MCSVTNNRILFFSFKVGMMLSFFSRGSWRDTAGTGRKLGERV